MKSKSLLWILVSTLVPAPTRSQPGPINLLTALRLSALDGAGADAVRYVGGAAVARSGEDIGAQINSAYASLPPTGGTIVVVADPGGRCYRFSTPIVANVPGKYLLLESGSLRLQVTTGTTGAACLDYTPTDGAAITLDYVPSGWGNNPAVTHGVPNLTIMNNHCETMGGCGSKAVGIAFGGANGGALGATFTGLRVIGFGTGLTVLHSRSTGGNLSFRDCTLFYNTTGFLDALDDNEQISFDACLFKGNGTGVSSSASVTISNSSLDSNTALGVSCSFPAACVLEGDQFENDAADTTHFLAGNGIFSVLGGAMRDDGTGGTTDWWMNFTGEGFLVLGTSLASGGRTATHVIVNDTAGKAVIQTNSPDLTRNLYSNPQLVSSLAQAIDGSPRRSPEPSVTDPAKTTSDNVAATAGQATSRLYDIGNIRIVDGTKYPANGAGVNQAFTDLSNFGASGGEVWLTTNVTANDYEITIPNGQTLRILSPLTVAFPILLGKYSHLTCNTKGSPTGDGNIIASQNMAQMVRAVIQDGSMEASYIDHCALNGNGRTFSGAGVVDLGGMNDVSIIDDLNIFSYSGAAAIGAVDATGFDPGPSHVNIDRIWANPGSSAPCLSFVHSSSPTNQAIQQIHIGYFECQNSTAANPIIIQSHAPSGYGGLLRAISIDFLVVDGETAVTNNVLLDGAKQILIKFVQCASTKTCVHITNNANNQDIDLGMTQILGVGINVLDDANGITRTDPILYNYHFLNPNALTDSASVHLDNQVFRRISIEGVENSRGAQLFNTTTTCKTAATAGSTCTTGAITLPVAYSDTNYRLVCTGISPTNVPALVGATKSNTSFTLTIAAITAAAATYDSFDCIAEHN